MTDEKHENLAENLRNMRIARNLSMMEFSKALDIPKSTLQAILEYGQTTLYTALHISEKLSIPLDILTSGSLTAQQFRRLDGLISQLEWYDKLSKEKKAQACELMFALIQLIQEEV